MKRFKTLKSYTLYTLLCVCVFTMVYYIISFIETEFNILNCKKELFVMALTLAIFISYGFCGCFFLSRNK